jgi:hypothetical protein
MTVKLQDKPQQPELVSEDKVPQDALWRDEWRDLTSEEQEEKHGGVFENFLNAKKKK